MIKKAYIGGGCFWGMEDLFKNLPGVTDTEVGYSGGQSDNPTYESHDTHAETLEVSYDTTMTTFTDILDFFFKIHDPTTLNRQGNDIGKSYRSVIFYQDNTEKDQATETIRKLDKSGKWGRPIVTTLEQFDKFHSAEDYHQDYLEKNPGGYTCHYIRQ